MIDQYSHLQAETCMTEPTDIFALHWAKHHEIQEDLSCEM